jgi:hypothetical protein
MEENHDFVRIYDGTNTEHQLIRELTGSFYSSNSFWSRQQNMYIHFVSDTAITLTGFFAQFQSTGTRSVWIML